MIVRFAYPCGRVGSTVRRFADAGRGAAGRKAPPRFEALSFVVQDRGRRPAISLRGEFNDSLEAMTAYDHEQLAVETGVPPAWRELLGRDHLGAAIVPAGGVLVGAINIYLAASLLPTAVAGLGGASFYAWNMTIYLVAMVIATMLTGRFLARWGNVGAGLLALGLIVPGLLQREDTPVWLVIVWVPVTRATGCPFDPAPDLRRFGGSPERLTPPGDVCARKSGGRAALQRTRPRS